MNDRDRDKDSIIQARIRVNKPIWNIFTGLIRIYGLNQTIETTKALSLWIEKALNVEFKCEKCKKSIDRKNCIVLIKDSKQIQYCSKECLLNSLSTEKTL